MQKYIGYESNTPYSSHNPWFTELHTLQDQYNTTSNSHPASSEHITGPSVPSNLANSSISRPQNIKCSSQGHHSIDASSNGHQETATKVHIIRQFEVQSSRLQLTAKNPVIQKSTIQNAARKHTFQDHLQHTFQDYP